MVDEPTTSESPDREGPTRGERDSNFRPYLEELEQQGKPLTLAELLRTAGRRLSDEIRTPLKSERRSRRNSPHSSPVSSDDVSPPNGGSPLSGLSSLPGLSA